MSEDEDISVDKNGAKDLTREEAREKCEYYLALAEKNTKLEDGISDEIDSADSTMAALILPGG